MVKSILLASDAPYKAKVEVRSHEFYMDEPKELEGQDVGATPMEYLAGSLAACTSITLRMYLDRKKWLFETIEVNVINNRSEDRKTVSFDVEVRVNANFDDKQWARVMHIAKACPVHKLLSKGTDISVVLIKIVE